MKDGEPWFTNPNFHIVSIEKSYYQCSCPACRVPFIVPEDLPSEEDFYGIDIFIVYCPVCGQKLRFSIDNTPTIKKTLKVKQ